MKHLSEETLADLTTALQAELAALREELGDHAVEDETGEWSASSESEGEEADSADAADNIEALATNVPLVADLKKREKELQDSLKRMQEGTYGTCTVCGEDIDEDRLEANPAATTCIVHAQ